MNILDIKDIHTICKLGSLRKAAKALGVSQPTLGNRITRLEGELGIKLFERSKGRTLPTRIAEFISERSEELIANADSLIQESLVIAAGTRGIVRIGFGPGCAYVLLTRIVRALREQNSLITLECHTGTTQRLTQRLAKGELDLVFGPFDEDQADSRLEGELLLEDEIVVITHPSHPLLSETTVDPEQFFQYPIALTNLEPRYQHIVSERYGHAIGEWDRSVLCSNYALLIGIIQDGLYVSAAPRYVVQDELEAGRVAVIPIPDGPITHSEHIIRNRHSFPYPALQCVEEIVRKEVSEITLRLQQRP